MKKYGSKKTTTILREMKKNYSSEISKYLPPAKVFPREMQKFRGSAKPQKFIPLK